MDNAPSESFDRYSNTKANGLLCVLSSDSYIVAVQSHAFLSCYMKSLSVLLQVSDLDILTAYEEIDMTKEILGDSFWSADKEFSAICKSVCKMTALTGRPEPEILCRRSQQTLRSNIPAETAKVYWRAIVVIPFLDSLTTEFNTRFQALTKTAVQ